VVEEEIKLILVEPLKIEVREPKKELLIESE
jgi:hypothetical protein